MTEPKYPELEYQPDYVYSPEDWHNDEAVLERHPAARFAYSPQDDEQSLLFVDGLAYPCPLPLAQHLCAHWEFEGDVLKALQAQSDPDDLVTQLINQGARSEERRVGKECRRRRKVDHDKPTKEITV